MLFTDSRACRSRRACKPCRDTGPNGQAFRQTLLPIFAVPGGVRDFACPYGVGWDAGEQAQQDHPAPSPAAPALPRSAWPWSVKAIALLAKPDDRGVGDTLARLLIGGETLAAAWQRLTGKECGCDGRIDSLNTRYAYDILLSQPEWTPPAASE